MESRMAVNAYVSPGRTVRRIEVGWCCVLGCSSRPKRDVLPESIHHSVVPAQYWQPCYHRSRAAGMSCCQMWATFAQSADQFAACSPEQADYLCKLKNQPQPTKRT